MNDLVVAQPISLGSPLDRGHWRSVSVPVDPQLDRLTLRLRCSPNWNASTVIRTRIVLSVDGHEYECVGRATGGRDGDYQLSYSPPVVRRGKKILRIGEVDHRSFLHRLTRRRRIEAYAEIEVLRGSVTLDVLGLTATASPAPWFPIHNSVAFDAATSAQELNGDGVISLTHTSTGSDRAVFAGVGGALNNTSTSMTYGAASMTEMWDFANGNNFNAGYYLAGQATGAQTVTNTGAVVNGFGDHNLGVVSFTGVDQTTPVGTAVTGSGASTAPSVTVSSVAADDMVVDQLHIDGTNTTTVGADQTQRNTQSTIWFGTEFRQSTQPGTAGGAMTWTLTSSATWSIGAVAFKAVSAPPPTGAIPAFRQMIVTP